MLRNLIKPLRFFLPFFSAFLFADSLGRLSSSILPHRTHAGKRRARHQTDAGERKSLAALNARRTVQTGNSQHHRQLPGRERDWRHTESRYSNYGR